MGSNNNFNSNYNNPCGRRKRQADGDETNTRLFGLLGGNNNGCNCGRRRRRQAPGEAELVSGSSVLKISWEEEITAAATVDTTNTLRTTTPAITTLATTTPVTTTNSRVDVSVTTS